MTVTLYTRQWCFHCTRAKHLLADLGVAYTEIPVDKNPEAMQEMRIKSNRRTVPQIWVGPHHIGGADELYDMHRRGRLLPMVREVAKINDQNKALS